MPDKIKDGEVKELRMPITEDAFNNLLVKIVPLETTPGRQRKDVLLRANGTKQNSEKN